MMKRKSLMTIVALFTSFVLTTQVDAIMPQKGGKGRPGGGNHNHGGGNKGRSFLAITPGGISYGYQNRNFGITIGGGGNGINLGGPVIRSNANYGAYYQPQPIYQPQFQNYDYPVESYPPNVVYPSTTTYSAPSQPVIQPSPIVTPTPTLSNNSTVSENSRRTSALTMPSNAAASQFKKRAETAFRVLNYKEARKMLDYALLEDNSNGHLLLFGSHISLALGDYERAMLELNAATKRIHQNDWDFIVRNIPFWYPNNEYDKQMKKLDQAVEVNGDVNAWTLRGFHRACDGQVAAAEVDLSMASELDPDNELVTRLLSSLQTQLKSIDSTNTPRLTPTPSQKIGNPVEVLPPPIEDTVERSVLQDDD